MPPKSTKKRTAPKTEGAERETSRRGRATAAKLIEFASKELDRVGPAKFDIDSVLRESKVSKGSLYHHFGSKNGLLVAVETHQFTKYLTDQNTLLRNLVETCQSAGDFLTLITAVMKLSGSPEGYDLRKKRIQAIVMAQYDKKLAELVKTAQINDSNYLAETLQIAKDRGWLMPDVDVLATSYWIQGLFIGHIMLDITGISDLDDAWNDVGIKALRSSINA
jgi:AcrR family transcriptional regulator